jgi:translocation protein SEC72
MSQTFQQLPLEMDGATKAINPSTPSPDPALTSELSCLNTLHRSIQTSHAPNAIPPSPLPVDPKRSAQITKLRETGNTSFRKQQYAEAIKLYSLAIEMALTRPQWEPAALVREEASQLYANRAQAYMAGQNWPEGSVDAQCSVDLKKVGNAKAWWRRGRCLLEMGRIEEARAWVAEGLEFEGQESELLGLMEEIKQRLAKGER